MKKFIIASVIAITMLFTTGCVESSEVKNEGDTSKESMFVAIEEGPSWTIVYHKDTKVMYAVSSSSYNCGNFTVLVEENGRPMRYRGE